MSIDSSINDIYLIKNVGTNLYLSLSSIPTGGLTNNCLVNGKAISHHPIFHWYVDKLNGTNTHIITGTDPYYALNATSPSSAISPCKMYKRADSLNTCTIRINKISGSSAYTIKLANYNKYLTFPSSSVGTEPVWADYTGNNNQKWIFTKEEPICTSKSLTMPINANQRYTGQHDWVKTYGCAACCAADVASFYNPSENNGYTVWELIDNGSVIINSGVVWSRVPATNFTDYTNFDILRIIREEIDRGRPVLVHMTGIRNGENAEHWIVAYKYTNNAANGNFVECLDPYGISTQSPGNIVTIRESVAIQNMTNVTYTLKLTSPK